MHSETYDFRTIESRWQKIWETQNQSLVTGNQSPVRKFYCLVMFPYPSGKIHMGHARNYCIGDVVARYKKMKGYKVLHPIGWDAFGLPAENAAIEHGADPQKWTYKNIDDMRQDIKTLGISYNWNCEFATCDPEYYRWNQWFFVQMFKKGLAFRKKSAVNWCQKCQTVLANEQVHDGNCWRCHSQVTQRDLDQWFFKITDYAERMLNDLKCLEGKWPDEVLLMQRNWIGKSVGAEVDFEIVRSLRSKKDVGHWTLDIERIKVFTTRPDTLFGCTFMVLAPEHPLVSQIVRSPKSEVKSQKDGATPKDVGHWTSDIGQIKKYCEEAKKKTKIERTSLEKEKTGVFTGLYAINPVNGEKVQIWVADYVLSDYGTGAIMAVPAHDQRDFEFAKKYNLPIIKVIESKESLEFKSSRVTELEKLHNSTTPQLSNSQPEEAYEGEGVLVNSGAFSGLPSSESVKKITDWLAEKGKGKKNITYRIRDWLISRQRYWGTPIPIVYCSKCGMVTVCEEDLPVLLPKNVQFTGKGESPLSQVKDFVQTKCPQCKGDARRETDTMDTFVDSSWYFLRYCDSKNESEAFDSNKANYWMPVDQYIGGIEHACMHLIYARFFYKVIYDLGLVSSEEPFENLLTQGMVTLGGSAMSKSKGNIVAVEDMVKEYGADTARLFVLFASPPRSQLEWSEEGVQGSWRFLNRVWRMGNQIMKSSEFKSSRVQEFQKLPNTQTPKLQNSQLLRKTHWTIKKVEEDIQRDFQFNTAIAALMELLNTLSDYPALGDETSRKSFQTLVTLLFPFAPHLTSEIWGNFGHSESLEKIPFPSYDPAMLKEDIIEIVIQVNGKLRAKFTIPAEDSGNETKIVSTARKVLSDKGLSIVVKSYKYVSGKLINFVTDQMEKVEVKK